MMRTKRVVVMGIVLLGMLVGWEAQAFYNPSSGRWLSRDPIGEEGGVNLSGLAGNDAEDFYDILGLVWDIKRTGGKRAHAKPQSGDTVASLAQLSGLDDKDYTSWLIPVGPTRMPGAASTPILECAEFTIPNTQYFEYGQMFEWIDRFGAIPAWQARLDGLATTARNAGFNVVQRNPSAVAAAREDLKDRDTYGWAFAGHGGGEGILVFASGEQAESLGPSRYTHLGINFLYAYGCDTAPKNPVVQPKHPFPFKYSRWEVNVAARGTFIGVWGMVNGYQAWSHIIQTPGTNSR